MRKFSANDKCMKCRYYCKKFIAFLFSHIGLCGLVVAYVILGAITFSYLEAPYEMEMKRRVQNLHNATVEDLWNITHGGSMGDLNDQGLPQTDLQLELSDSRSSIRRQFEEAAKETVKDLWNLTLEMNVLYEKNWTREAHERVLQNQKLILDILFNLTNGVNSTMDASYLDLNHKTRDLVKSKIYRFEKEILQEVRQHGYDGDDDAEGGTVQWSVAGGLLYSLTVITTIGYGHIAPKTVWGKLITMLYAILGIPLMLLCLANIGDALAHAFKFFYWKVCCLYCEMKKRRRRLMRIQSVRMSRKSNRSNMTIPNNVGSASMHTSFKIRPPSADTLEKLEKPEKPAELQLPNTHTLIRMSPTPSPTMDQQRSHDSSADNATTSNGHSSDVNSSKLPPLAMDDDELEDEKLAVLVPEDIKKRKMSVCNMPPESIEGIDYADESPLPSPTHLSPDENTAVIIHDVEEDDHRIGEYEPRYEKVTVPVYICLLVVFGYIIGGSILFASWEKWNYFDGAYFCFITLTTIGFGDFVPGVSSSGDYTQNSEEKLTLCSLYLVFGMALLAMSFNLVQEAVTEKAKWIARKIGILSEDSEEED